MNKKINFNSLKKILETEKSDRDEINFYFRVKEANIKDKKQIKYILSKYGMGLGCFGDNIKNDKEIVLIALKQNGQAIAFASPLLQRDKQIIKLSKKIGRTDKLNGKKTKYYLPDITYWYLKYISKNNKTKKFKIINKLKLNIINKGKVAYYSGETINGVPFGKGISEEYETSNLISKIKKKVGKNWSDKYTKSYLVKLINHNLNQRYEGEWAWGVWHGKGELTEYHDPAHFTNKDGGPEVMEKYIGNFDYGKKL